MPSRFATQLPSLERDRGGNVLRCDNAQAMVKKKVVAFRHRQGQQSRAPEHDVEPRDFAGMRASSSCGHLGAHED